MSIAKTRRRQLIVYARQNRKHATPAEQRLWRCLCKHQLGVRFRHQAKFPPHYIADFVCHPKRLIIEIDGSSHQGRQAYDAQRTRVLEHKGYMVLRFTNEEVLRGLPGVLKTIERHLKAMPRYKRSLEGWIIGDRNLRAFFHVRVSTLLEWCAQEDFPLSRLPNGTYVVDQTLAGIWLLKRAKRLKELGKMIPAWIERRLRIKAEKGQIGEQSPNTPRASKAA